MIIYIYTQLQRCINKLLQDEEPNRDWIQCLIVELNREETMQYYNELKREIYDGVSNKRSVCISIIILFVLLLNQIHWWSPMYLGLLKEFSFD